MVTTADTEGVFFGGKRTIIMGYLIKIRLK